MKRLPCSAALVCAALTACTVVPPAGTALALRGMGSMHVGGREVAISGKPVTEVRRTPGGPLTKVDPNGVYQVEQMYAQYFLPANRRGAVPLMLWHGGGLTGVTFETTPDGREGWLNYFIARGWDTYNVDAVERGRSGWASPDVFAGAPIFLTKTDPYERFRLGAGLGSYDNDPAKRKSWPGNLFPQSAYDNFTRQFVPRWLSTDAAVTAGYAALVNRVCPCVLVVHSQGGQFAFTVAQQHPEKIRAIVAVEPAGFGDAAKAAALKDIPILAIYGDFLDRDARWATIRQNGLTFYKAIEAAGGKVEVIDLPVIGIRGNSHMIPMDTNSDVVAGLIQDWLARRSGAYRPAP